MESEINKEKRKQQQKKKKEIAKAYGQYTKQFTPRPRYFVNCLKAFLSGGLICTASLWMQNYFTHKFNISHEDAGVMVTLVLVSTAQLLTGIGVFDVIARYAGAGVIVPITGFANSMAATAIEYKKEGPVLGAGAKLFTVAGPVLVCGITSGIICGIIYWITGLAG